VIVFFPYVLAQLIESPIEVLLFAGEKDPTWTCMEAAPVLLKAWGSVHLGVDANRDEESVLTQTIAERLLNLLEIPIHRRTNAGAGGKERVDNHDFSFQHIVVKAHLLTVLINQLHIGEILLSR
jgi:hypothetical protein